TRCRYQQSTQNSYIDRRYLVAFQSAGNSDDARYTLLKESSHTLPVGDEWFITITVPTSSSNNNNNNNNNKQGIWTILILPASSFRICSGSVQYVLREASLRQLGFNTC